MIKDDFFFKISGVFIIFSFFSMISIFLTLLFIGSSNNYIIYHLNNISMTLINDGVVTSTFSPVIDLVSGGVVTILPYIDYLWFISFILICVNSIIFSYYSKRQDYFSIFTFAIFGIMIFIYVGSIFIEATTWFQTNILNAVFPTYSSYFPFFSWYIDKIAFTRKLGSSGDVGSANMCGLYNATANDEISLKFRSDNSNSYIQFENFNINAQRLN